MAPLLKSSRSSTPSLKMTPFWGMYEVNAQQIGAERIERIEQGRVLDALQDPTSNGLVLSKLPPALKCGGFPADCGRSPVSGFGFNDRQSHGSVTRDCQRPDVPGGVPIGVSGEPAVLAQEHSLALAVGLLAMAALGACPAGIARVHLHDADSRVLRLVREEAIDLVERPARQSVASIFASSRDLAVYPLEVLKSNAAVGVFGGLDDRFRDAMVLMPAEPGFLAGDPP
jgi:hypothetical protein